MTEYANAHSPALSAIPSTKADCTALLTALARTSGRILDITGAASVETLHRPPAPDAWSARDIVAHLRACAAVWGRSVERMIAEDAPTMRYVSPRGWITRTNWMAQDFASSAEAFAREREMFLALLRPLDAAGWSRRGTFTGTTRGRNATVYGYAHRILEHEAGHLGQLQRTIGA